MHVINDKLVYAISGPFRRNTEIFKGANKTLVNAHNLTTFISLIFAAVLSTLISDERHISWAH